MKYNFKNPEHIQKARARLSNLIAAEKVVEVREIKNTRSSQQNRALHLYFKFITQELNEMGHEFTYLGVKGYELSTTYTEEIVKNFFWRPIQKALFEIESTKEIDTDQMNQIIDVINKFFAEKGVFIPFPSYESLINSGHI